jgi:NADP-dependent 3-hydroxy acid dehydrogenase YdfG
MARIFITGSANGLGQLTATALVAQRHEVVLHARNEKRGQEALDKVPGAETVLTLLKRTQAGSGYHSKANQRKVPGSSIYLCEPI